MYISVDALKRYLGISTTTDDVLLNEMIEAAQGMIDDATRRTFEVSADTTRYFDAVKDTDGYVLWFDDDIVSITTVLNGDASNTEVTSSEYTTMPRNETPYYGIKILLSANKYWEYVTDSEGAISVAGKWAYSTTPPAAIKQACTRLAAYLYRQKDNANDIDRALVVGNATVLPGQIPADVRTLLKPYMRMVI